MKITIISKDGTSKPIPQMPERTSLALILVYGWDGINDPFLLERESGRKWPSGGKLPLYRSLHVYASGETDIEENDEGHARQAFHKAAELLGVNAVIDFGSGGAITPTNPPPGLAFLETNLTYFETLGLRRALGEILEGGPGEIPVVLPRTDFRSGNCGPLAG